MPILFKKPGLPGWPLTVMLVAALLLAVLGWRTTQALPSTSAATELVLLVPDDLDRSDPVYLSWLDALREEGFSHITMSASELIRASSSGTLKARGLILPDTFHRRAGVALIDAVKVEVQRGAHLLLTYDAAIASPSGFVSAPHKLRRLAGLEYALYDQPGSPVTASGPLLGSPESVRHLELPPGRLVPARTANSRVMLQASAYGYKTANFPHFVTAKVSEGTTLLRSDTSVLAHVNQVGRGSVLFVNLPLGYLKTRTDGLWLHSFVRYFGIELVAAPRLAAAPNAVGGLVINWHVDDRKALGYLHLLEQIGFAELGPFSIHLTAGPDTDAVGDGKGMDLRNNPVMLRWVRAMAARGHSFGSHGGWIHNVFSAEVNENSREQHQQLIRDNFADVNAAVGQPVKEYSAPSGNHPLWTSELLAELGVRSYYTTGNAGMAPTRTRTDASGSKSRPWAFPISALGQAASFEEANDAGIPSDQMLNWLEQVADYSAEHRAVRLFYFHPIGVSMYPEAARTWLEKVKHLQQSGVLRLYTMAQMSEFLDRREAVKLDVVDSTQAAGYRIDLASPVGLEEQVLMLPKSRFKRPVIKQGQATVDSDPKTWLVHVATGNRLQLEAEAIYE